MAVYDKELIINGEAVRSPEQQIYKNMKDIKDLKEEIKPTYKCTVELSSSATTVAKSNTNAGTEVKSGWLLDPNGKKFKITGGDDDNLLIDFYTSYQGPQGESGLSAIDDNSTSATKVWSSQKTNNEITGLIDDSDPSATKVWSSQKVSNKIDLISDKGVYYTLVQPTLSDGLYLLNVSDLGNDNQYTWQKYGDLVIYIDGNGNPAELWKCVALNGAHTVMTVEKIADYGGGKTLYKHNLELTRDQSFRVYAEIINDSNVQFDFDTLFTYLPKASDMSNSLFKTKGVHVWGFALTGANNDVDASNHNNYRQIIAYTDAGTNYIILCFEPVSGNLSNWWQGNSRNTLNVVDTVEPL